MLLRAPCLLSWSVCAWKVRVKVLRELHYGGKGCAVMPMSVSQSYLGDSGGNFMPMILVRKCSRTLHVILGRRGRAMC